MKKRHNEIIFTSYDIAEMINCREDAPKVTKAFTKDNQQPVTQANQHGGGHGSYYWDLDNVSQGVYDNLVEFKLLPSTIVSFIDFKSIIKLKTDKFKATHLTKQDRVKLKENPITISEEEKTEEDRLNTILKAICETNAETIKQIAEEKRRKADEKNRKRLEEFIKIGGDVKAYIDASWFAPRDTKYIIHCGDTNSGKSYNAIKRMKESNKGIYLAPLRLLAWEVAERINNEFDDSVCSLITGEEKVYANNELFVSATVEMMDYSTYFDVVVIDEAFMIGDRSRGKSWLKAIAEAQADEVHIIVNKEAVGLITDILETLGRTIERHDYTRLTPLTVPLKTVSRDSFKDKTIFVVFDRRSALETKRELEAKNHKVSVLYGNLPPEVRKEQMAKFISGEHNMCVATDVIGMGVNLPCDNIVFKALSKFDGIQERPLNATEVRQIGGRAGRYGLSDGGFVYAENDKGQRFIAEMMDKVTIMSDAKFGLDFNIFDNIPKTGYADKLTFFTNIDPIPDKLKPYIKKQSVDEMMDLATIVDAYKKDLTNEEAWNLIILPVKQKLNLEYFSSSVYDYVYRDKIGRPYNYMNEIYDQNTLFYAEKCAAEFDLFLYMSNNRILGKKIDEDDVRQVKEDREVLVERINQHLLDKKNCGIKRCRECGKVLKDTYYNLCESCYRNNRRIV